MAPYPLIDLVMILFGLGWLLRIAKENKKWLPMIPIVIGIICLVGDYSKQAEKTVLSKLAQEVKLEQVPVSGQRDFNAQIHLLYKDGKLDTVTLVPNTTIIRAPETKKE